MEQIYISYKLFGNVEKYKEMEKYNSYHIIQEIALLIIWSVFSVFFNMDFKNLFKNLFYVIIWTTKYFKNIEKHRG